MATLELRQIHKSFANVDIVKGVDLTVHDREFIVFVGPSGSGKSTLLRIIAGLEDATDGELRIDGVRVNEVPPDRRGLAMVFQSYALYPHMTVAENMGFALRMSGIPSETRTRKVNDAARILELGPLLDRKPKQLSGGQRQRVAIGRAIVREPKAFLFDEPLSNLDAALRVQMRLEVAKLHRELQATTIYVTHDQVEAMTLADRIVVLNGGRIEQVGTPLELYHWPVNTFVAGFIGSPRMNLVDAQVTALKNGRVRLSLDGGGFAEAVADGASIGDHVTLGMRPEHLSVSADGAIMGKVEVVERLGDATHAYIDIGARDPLAIKTFSDHRVAVDDLVRLALRRDAAIVFDAGGRSYLHKTPRSLRSLPLEAARYKQSA